MLRGNVGENQRGAPTCRRNLCSLLLLLLASDPPVGLRYPGLAYYDMVIKITVNIHRNVIAQVTYIHR